MDHFDLLAPLYDRLIAPPTEDYLSKFASLPVQGQVLDVGGGTGRIAAGLRDKTGSMILLDRSRRMLLAAGEKTDYHRVAGSSDRLPFSTDSFERVLVVDAYHHFSNQVVSLQELWRVVAPGGKLVIEEPDIEHFAVKLIALAEKLTLFTSHFERADKIGSALENLGASIEIHRRDHNAWVVAEKPV
jgi:ubiquinone/menaquinone biosynthesis C-methylase UbiE